MVDETAIHMSEEAAGELIRRSLALWGMSACDCRVLRHNENLACQVDSSSGNRYLLRICQPKTTALVGIQQSVAAIESEMAWLRAVKNDTGLPLQAPVESVRGRYVEEVRHPNEDRTVPVLLLTWVHGEMLDQRGPDADRLLTSVGRVQRVLHEQAMDWQRPEWFHRPLYDEASLLTQLVNLKRGVAAGIVRPEDYEPVRQAADRIVEVLRDTPKTPESWGPIHMDWIGNLVVAQGTPVPIDFSLSGLGFYLQDVAQCISNVQKPLRPAYLEGYGREFTCEELLRISAYILMIIFITAGRNVFNPKWREWLQARRLPVIAGEFCPKLLAGQPFHLEL